MSNVDEQGRGLCTTSGESVEEVRAKQTNQTGQHAAYIVLCEDERQKGFVRPYRDAYKHVGRLGVVCGKPHPDPERAAAGWMCCEFPHEGACTGWTTKDVLNTGCGTVTTMGRALSETYARDPSFYGATFCVRCNKHLPVGEFIWIERDGTNGPRVGS